MEFIFCLKDQASRRVFQEDRRVDPFNETVANTASEAAESLEDFLARKEKELFPASD